MQSKNVRDSDEDIQTEQGFPRLRKGFLFFSSNFFISNSQFYMSPS